MAPRRPAILQGPLSRGLRSVACAGPGRGLRRLVGRPQAALPLGSGAGALGIADQPAGACCELHGRGQCRAGVRPGGTGLATSGAAAAAQRFGNGGCERARAPRGRRRGRGRQCEPRCFLEQRGGVTAGRRGGALLLVVRGIMPRPTPRRGQSGQSPIRPRGCVRFRRAGARVSLPRARPPAAV